MKGIIFIKFGEFIEQQFGEFFWDQILESTSLASGGVYTSFMHYEDREFFHLLELVVSAAGLSPEQAQFSFGQWIFKELYTIAPSGSHQFTDVFSFLNGVQNVIHVEVNKLHPEAILPQFTFIEQNEAVLKFVYHSPRQLCHFCEGIIHGLADFTQQQVKTHQPECEHRGDSRCVIEVVLE